MPGAGPPHPADMITPGPVNTIAHNIQLAVAPVFLLSGIGAILNVLAARLGRAVDRARKVEGEIDSYDPALRSAAILELGVLDRRIGAVHRAIAMCTMSALFVCILVAVLFVGDFIVIRAAAIVALLFITAMALLIAGLLLFLHEVRIATRSVRVKGILLAELKLPREG